MINLSDPIERSKLAFKIKQDIDNASQAFLEENEPRKHLGASIVGHNCSAYIWGVFRWLKQEKHDGRVLRFFNRGHLEEARFIKWLQLVGFTVWDVDPQTGKQFRINGVNGHFGGSLDAIIQPPGPYNITQSSIFLGEFKTHNDKSFQKLKKEGVRLSKPQHFKQMSSYGKCYNFKYGLYLAVNKNDDEIWPEIIELDFALADDLFRKADSIINSQTQPPKIAKTETYFECRYCYLAGICHRGEEPEKNCRSCIQAMPTENASWTCMKFNSVIPDEVIIKGCNSWERII